MDSSLENSHSTQDAQSNDTTTEIHEAINGTITAATEDVTMSDVKPPEATPLDSGSVTMAEDSGGLVSTNIGDGSAPTAMDPAASNGHISESITPQLVPVRASTPTAATNSGPNSTPVGMVIPPANAHGSSTRVYVNQKITPHLLEGMKWVAANEPEKPLKWLSEFLARKSAEVED